MLQSKSTRIIENRSVLCLFNFSATEKDVAQGQFFLMEHSWFVNWITMTRNIRQTLTHENTGQAVSTLLGLISSVYCDLHHWRSIQRPQIAEPKLYNWDNSPCRTQVTPN